MSSGGRYPCLLFNSILGNRQEATVVFGQAEKHLDQTPKKPLLSVLSKRSCVSSFPKQNHVSDNVFSLHAKFHAQKCSLTSPELLR